jgi:two-component system nitrate/nitrite response regulator NarL
LVIVGEASNGKEAIALLNAMKPDILLLDVHMPGKDGLAVLREMDLDAQPTRVIMLTAAEDDRDIARAMNLGASAYILKPFSKDLLLKSIRRVLPGRI